MIPCPGFITNATITPNDQREKWSRSQNIAMLLRPPTDLFRSPILTMPKVMVRKMMGLIRSLTALINMPARNSLRVEPMFISGQAVLF
jgi:hypothetical protein